MRIVQLMTDWSRYFNPSKNYWFSFSAFLISLIGLYFRYLSFWVVLVNTARPDGVFLFVVWFIHWKHMIRPFLFIDKQKRKLSAIDGMYVCVPGIPKGKGKFSKQMKKKKLSYRIIRIKRISYNESLIIFDIHYRRYMKIKQRKWSGVQSN